MSSDSRSRRGCVSCRQRRRKCGEETPSCSSCVSRGICCEYGLNVRWSQIKFTSKGNRLEKRKPHKIANRTTNDDCSPVIVAESPSSYIGFVDGREVQEQEYGFGRPGDLDVDGGETLMDTNYYSHYSASQNPVESRDADWDFSDGLEPLLDRGIIESAQNEEVDGPEVPTEAWELDHSFFSGFLSTLFPNPSEGIAYVYYIRTVSTVIAAHDTPRNPYRQLAAMALCSPVLMDTIMSLSTEYMFIHGGATAEMAVARHQTAIKSIRQALATMQVAEANDGTDRGYVEDIQSTVQKLSAKQEVLAAVLMQISNAIFSGSSGVDIHIRCSIHLLQGLGYLVSQPEGYFPRLLTQRFAMIEIVSCILWHRRPSLPCSFWMYQRNDELDTSQPSFQEMTGCPQPVLGVLASILHLTADLEKDRSRNIYGRALKIETELTKWGSENIKIGDLLTSPLTPELSNVPFLIPEVSTKDHVEALASLFYWTAHLLLQRRVYEDPSNSSRVRHTVNTMFTLIESIPTGSGPDSAIHLPFFVVAREALSKEEREFIRQSNQRLGVQGERVRAPMMAIIEQIWRRKDQLQLCGSVESLAAAHKNLLNIERRNTYLLY